MIDDYGPNDDGTRTLGERQLEAALIELAKLVYLEAAYQHDMKGWGWERFTRAQWATSMLGFNRILTREAHAVIETWYASLTKNALTQGSN
jgi:hypothetical protein